MNVFVLAILFYLLYRFIGGFLIPLLRTTRTVRHQFRNMNGNGQTGNQPHSAPEQPKPEEPKSTSSKVGEYIDFEEVK